MSDITGIEIRVEGDGTTGSTCDWILKLYSNEEDHRAIRSLF